MAVAAWVGTGPRALDEAHLFKRAGSETREGYPSAAAAMMGTEADSTEQRDILELGLCKADVLLCCPVVTPTLAFRANSRLS